MRFLILAIICLIPTAAFADGPYKSNGYYLNATISHLGSGLQLEGRVNNGNACQNLVIAANARGNDGQVVYLESEPFNYPGGGMGILFESKTRRVDRLKNGWRLTAVDAFCGGRPR